MSPTGDRKGKTMLFGEKLKKLRKARGLSQTDLAKLADTTKNTILCYENGKFYPRHRDTYTKLAAALNCSEYYLLSEDTEPEIMQPSELPVALYNTYLSVLNLLFIFDEEVMEFSFDLVSKYLEISEYTLMRAIEYWERLNYLTIKDVNGKMLFYVSKFPDRKLKRAC